MTKHVKATVFKADISQTTKQIHDDSFDYEADGLIEPPYNITELKQIAEYSTILQQCIDAYKTNILGFGLGVEYTFDFNAEDAPEAKNPLLKKNGRGLRSLSDT